MSTVMPTATQVTYDDLFIRSNLGDTGTIPRSGTQSRSPDVIPYGTDPVADPQAFFSGNYNQDVGKDLVANARNYLYLRAKNLAAGAETGSFYLYYAPSNLLLWPNIWQNNVLKTSTGADSVPVSAAKNGDIVVTRDPFTWTPQIPSGFHYCMVSRLVTPLHANPIPDVGSIQDFAAWVAGNGGIGWRNVTVVSTGAPTWSLQTQLSQGAAPSALQFQIICQNVPLGSYVSFSSGTQVPGYGPVAIGKTQVTSYPSFIVAVRVPNVPAGWTSNFSYSYWAKDGSPPPSGFDITLDVSLPVEAEDERLYALAATHDELGLGGALFYDPRSTVLRAPPEEVALSRLIRVGSQSTYAR